MPDQEHDPLAFAQLLLALLDEGRRTATYKLAVLLALIDCCAKDSDPSGRAPSRIPTRDLARRVVELYWPQVRPYALTDDVVLRQSSQPRAVTVEAVVELRRATPRAMTLDAAELLAPEATGRCLDVVELNLVRMPLGKLQRPLSFDERSNADYPRFLYDDSAFHERLTRAELQRQPLVVHLRDGAADWLVSLSGLLRPLIELHWTRQVAQFNRLTLGEDRLREFLFGAERRALQHLQPGLREAQDGRCFYCTQPLAVGAVQVDHFVPWARVPNDGLANLVLADSRCNNSKSDNYADLELLDRWSRRPRATLADAATDARWPLRLGETLGIARGLYSHLPQGTRLWTQPGVFTMLDRARLSDLLPSLVP
jgi:5-methylcytosine-specific restriction endonuclease McrA